MRNVNQTIALIRESATTRRAAKFALLTLAVLAIGAHAWASEADTSATASRGVNGNPGTAGATAHYEGDVGFARTNTRTGVLNIARSVAVGVDENGLSLSVSTALAPLRGPALASNFNISIGTDGRSAVSVGNVTARGGGAGILPAPGGVGILPATERTVATAGSTSAVPHNATAISQATGRTSPGGVVHATTDSRSAGPKVVIRNNARERYVTERGAPEHGVRILVRGR